MNIIQSLQSYYSRDREREIHRQTDTDRERERERERERDRQTDRQRETERERYTDRQTHRERERERERETDREKQRERERERERELWKTLREKVKLLKMSNFTFFHNVFYATCILKSFNSHISVVICSFFEFGTVSKWCIGEWVKSTMTSDQHEILIS